MENSLTDALQQLISIQYQQLTAINGLANSQNTTGAFSSSPVGNYSDYSPSYSPPPNPFSPSTNNLKGQFNSYAAQINPTNTTFMDVVTVNNARLSAENRQALVADYGTKVANAAIAGTGSVVGMAADWSMSSIAPGFIGTAAGTAAGSATAAIFNGSLNQSRQQGSYNKYLLQNSYKFINPSESNNDRNVAGFNNGERWEASTFLRKFGTSQYISDKDTSLLLQNYAEGGLLKETKDLESFKKRMSELTKYTKEAALTLNSTFEEISKMMADLEKSGINAGNLPYLSAKGKITGSNLGISGSQAINSAYGAVTSMTYGTDMNSGVMMSSYLGLMSSVGGFYDSEKALSARLGKNTSMYNFMSNSGGIEGSSQIANSALRTLMTTDVSSMLLSSMFSYNDQTGDFEYNKNGVSGLKDSIGKNGARRTSVAAQTALQQLDPFKQNLWKQKSGTYINNLDLDSTEFWELANMSVDNYMETSGYDLTNVTTEQKLQVLRNQFGWDSNTASFIAKSLDYSLSDEGRQKALDSKRYTFAQESISEMQAKNPGALTRFKNMGEAVKDALYVPLQEAGQAIGQKVTDTLYGKTINPNELVSSQITAEELSESLSGAAKQLHSYGTRNSSTLDIKYYESFYNKQIGIADKAIESFKAGKVRLSNPQNQAIQEFLDSTDPNVSLDSNLFKDPNSRSFYEKIKNYKAMTAGLNDLKEYNGSSMVLSNFGSQFSEFTNIGDKSSQNILDAFSRKGKYGIDKWENLSVGESEERRAAAKKELAAGLMGTANSKNQYDRDAFKKSILNSTAYSDDAKNSIIQMFNGAVETKGMDNQEAAKIIEYAFKEYSGNYGTEFGSEDQSINESQKSTAKNTEDIATTLDNHTRILQSIADNTKKFPVIGGGKTTQKG